MSGDMEELAPESEEEALEKQRELIEDAKETKQELDERQQEALAAIGEGEDFESYTTVELGALELEVDTNPGGNVIDRVIQAQEVANRGDESNMRESIDTFMDALSQLTKSQDYNTQFWQAYWEEYGIVGMIEAAETVFSPIEEAMEERQEGAESFRQRKR